MAAPSPNGAPEAMFTKTGAGTLVLTNDLAVTGSNTAFTFSETGVTTPKLVNAGGLVVAEGTVRCVAGAVAWKGGSVGAGRLVTFTCEEQTVVATVTSGGTMLILR